MFSLVNINLLSIKAGPTVTAIGYLGFGDGASPNPESAQTLHVEWETPAVDADAFALLSWHSRVSDFTGRDAETNQLEEWATKGERDIRIQFVIADGGMGKSRAVGPQMHLCIERSRRLGADAGRGLGCSGGVGVGTIGVTESGIGCGNRNGFLSDGRAM
ncbi:MAG: hypothetical protein JXX14_00855 [Deltaproteobacteria bacterium]|nr:hypothetical protein [Deltaproteobacteria bacterium]